jgi:uncharacterized protein YdhG (YjbR/CyaY superfamily)
MNKSNKKYKDINEYHAAQAAEFREMLEKLRQTIKQAAPYSVEAISYGMPAFRQNKILVYYALNKEHIGFYPTSTPIIHFKKELEKFKTSKGAIQFPLNKPLPLALIKKIVKFRLDEDVQSTNKKILSGVVHEVPRDMERVLKADTGILNHWNKLTAIQRNEWICWVTIVKKTETREEHLHRMIEELKEGKRQPCCWPGCLHRRPSAQKWFKNIEK